jgi:calcineurin-like phosphoesterase family protein
MKRTWFTSDLHFNHKNIIRFSNRPFANVDEMNEAMISNWNELVDPQDDIYMLGDFAFVNKKSQVENLFRRLNGHIHWIFGNHDKSFRNSEGCAWSGDYKEIKVGTQKFVLSHYPMVSWNGQYRGTIMLHGHCHGNLKHDGTKLRLDVGVDCWDWKPVSVEQILSEIDSIKKNNMRNHKQEIVTDDHH